jgi:hypothetical protein
MFLWKIFFIALVPPCLKVARAKANNCLEVGQKTLKKALFVFHRFYVLANEVVKQFWYFRLTLANGIRCGDIQLLEVRHYGLPMSLAASESGLYNATVLEILTDLAS